MTNNTDIVEALRFYAEHGENCRKLGGILEGDASRNALSQDGGKRAKAALASLQTDTPKAQAVPSGVSEAEFYENQTPGPEAQPMNGDHPLMRKAFAVAMRDDMPAEGRNMIEDLSKLICGGSLPQAQPKDGLVEKVERAIFAQLFHGYDVETDVEDEKWLEWDQDRERSQNQAQAALAAIQETHAIVPKEPTKEMISAYFLAVHEYDIWHCKRVYAAMLKAAGDRESLKQGDPPHEG